MEARDQKSQRDRQYHHGDLRRALLDAALQLASERGIANFTLREVARLAGVSHNAPYHHFADKAALVEALVVENFELLERDLREAYEQAKGTSLDKLLAAGVAYVRFALQHPAVFRLMFRPELHQHGIENENDPVELAGRESYQILLNATCLAQQEGLIAADMDVQLLSIAAWSMVHGLAVLLLDNSVQKLLPAPQDDEQLARYVTRILSDGIRRR